MSLPEHQPMKSTPRDVFVYLLATIALYFSAYAVIALLLGYINILLPDPLKDYYFDPRGSIRWPLALLVVIFPVYVWASRFIRRDIAHEPAKADIRVRRWLLNLTLFLAALLIIGDLVGLMFNFLEGDLTTQFTLKVVAVLTVAASVFWVYLYDLRTKGAKLHGNARVAVQGIIAAVILVAVSGFVLAGSPFRQRLIQFDDRKIGDLQNIQSQLVNVYWMNKRVLPVTLSELRSDIMGFVPPADPQSGEPYRYRVTGELSFELCATFNLPTPDDRRTVPKPADGAYVEVWEHPEGEYCFSRTIDPELYRKDSELRPIEAPMVR